MKQLFIISLIFLYLISGVSSADESPYDKVNEERIDAERNFFRARTLVDGLKANKSLSRRIYFSAIKKAEQYVATSNIHLSKSREYLLKGYHDGSIGESPATELKALLKNLKDDIADLGSSIDELHANFSDKAKKVAVKGPEGKVAVNDFLDWHDFLIKLRKTESSKWAKSDATKKLWKKASGDLGLYGIHIEHLADSVIYAGSRKRITQQDYDYVKDGMKRFMEFHDQFIALLGKVKAANNADLRDRQKMAEELIRPYLAINVFSALPAHSVIASLPADPTLDLGYIPSQSMMQVFSTLKNRPSLKWLKESENAMQVFRTLYDNGVAHSFLKRFVNLGGKLTVEVTDDSSANESVRLSFGGDLYIPKDRYVDGKLKTDPDLLANILHEMFHVYSNQVVDNNKDPATRAILENTESWITGQYIRLESNRNSSRPWSKFSDQIDDAKSFTRDYLAGIINVAVSSHLVILDKFNRVDRDSRITLKRANADWAKAESLILTTQFSADQNDDGVKWDVQSVPPDFILNYIYALYGCGVY